MAWLVVGLSLPMVILGGPAIAARSDAPVVRALAPAAAAPSGTPGAAALGTTQYAIPAGAHFVSPAGSDTAAGTQAAPWATLGHAVAAAPTKSTIVLLAGIYRESVTIASKVLTIQPAPNQAVIVRGSSIITGFVASGTTWVRSGWTYQFPRQDPRDVTTAHPLANASDQVFVDGKELAQVGSATAVKAGSFFVNYTTHQLVIGVNPAGHTIEASTRQNGLHLERAAGTVVRGIQFDEYATPADMRGAVLDSSGGAQFENDIFTNNATAGLSVQGPNTLVDQDTFTNNGELGLHGNQADHIHVTGCEMRHNNIENFNVQEEAGGMKLSSSNNVLIDNNLTDGNLGKGMWMDIGSEGTTMVRNEADGNTTEGFQIEISSGAVVAGNVAWHNTEAGVRVIESQHVDIYNNVLYANGSAIDVWEGTRRQNVADITIRNNVIMDGTPSSVEMLDIRDTTKHLTGAQMGVSTDADAFCRTTPTKPGQIAAWANGTSGQAHYASVATYAKATGRDAHGIACDGAAANKMLSNASAGNFALAPGSPGAGAGAPLPSNVANALDVSPGVAVDLGILSPGVVHGPGPVITLEPVSTSVLVGQPYTLRAAATGKPAPSVQWQVSTNGVSFTNIVGATSTKLAGVGSAADSGKEFRAVFANSGGTATSDAATLTVSVASVTIEDPGPLVWGQKVNLVADVALTGVPTADVTGWVTFYDGSTEIGTRAHLVDAGQASLPLPRLDAGDHTFTAVYTWKTTTATSPALIEEIDPASTSITLGANRAKVEPGQTVTLRGRVVPIAPSTGTVTDGTISFYDSGTLLDSVEVVNGVASITPIGLTQGDHDITAVYDGGTNAMPSPVSIDVIVTIE
jgi:hypothetical protein